MWLTRDSMVTQEQTSALDAADWSGDIDNAAVTVEKYANTGDQRLAMNSPEKDVTVSTKITGLTAGKTYVAELYVDNESDAKATLSVNTGSKEVSNYTMRSFSRNTVASDEKHGTNMQRILVSFTAEGTIADLKLSRAAGEGSTYWDDIRIVQKTLDNYAEDGSFHQDFESVVERNVSVRTWIYADRRPGDSSGTVECTVYTGRLEQQSYQ